MGKLFTSGELKINSISYHSESHEIIYVFFIDGVEIHLTGKMYENARIRGVGYTDELDEFIMSIMPFDPEISKKLFALSWGYVDGEDIKLPITLTSPN